MKDLEGRTAVVIGGGSGIGRGIALAFAGAGMGVAVADLERESAESVAGEIEARGGRARGLRADATDAASLAALAEAAAGAFGAVHVLSNNAGVTLDKPLAECSERDWAWVMEFNFFSAVRSVAAFLPRLRAEAAGGRGAHVVHTASMAAVLALPHSPRVPAHIGAYTASKHALLGYCEMLRGELEPEGIGVSVLCPGLVRSNLGATSARNRPQRFGGPLPDPGPLPAALEKIMMAPEEVGPCVVAAVRENRFHVFTHPEQRPLVEARAARLFDDFEFAAALRR